MPLVALVDTHLRDCPDAQLPNSSKHKSKNDAVDELVLKAGSPEIIKFLWNEFGLAIKTNENDGPILSEILIYSKKYDPLISEQISKFGYELVCTDWSEVSVSRAFRLVLRFSQLLPHSRSLEQLHDFILRIRSRNARKRLESNNIKRSGITCCAC